MKDLMKLFNGSSIDSLRDKSNNAVSIFRKTIQDLQQVNSLVVEETKKREEQIEVLKKENQDLAFIKVDNDKFIDKINEFLS